jgi:AraC-like DNA-binding protein
MVRQRPPTTTAEIVAEIVRTRRLEGRSDIDGVAERLGAGARTLQRRLDSESRPYRQILAEVRLARARSLLTDTGMPIVEIALALGYSDQAHFNRAFRREVGVAPSSYRHTHA